MFDNYSESGSVNNDVKVSDSDIVFFKEVDDKYDEPGEIIKKKNEQHEEMTIESAEKTVNVEDSSQKSQSKTVDEERDLLIGDDIPEQAEDKLIEDNAQREATISLSSVHAWQKETFEKKETRKDPERKEMSDNDRGYHWLNVIIVQDISRSFGRYESKMKEEFRRAFSYMDKVCAEQPVQKVKFGLVTFKDIEDGQSVIAASFGDGMMTVRSEDIMRKIADIKYDGGNIVDGRERSAIAAISTAVKMLDQHYADNAESALLFISDSCPDKEDLRYDFTVEQEHRLRYAAVFSYDGSFRPKLKLSDEDHRASERNYMINESLRSILKDLEGNRIATELSCICKAASLDV